MADQPPNSPRPDETPVDGTLLPEADIEALLAEAEALASDALEAAGVGDELEASNARGSSPAFDADDERPASEQIEAQLARIQELVDEAAEQASSADQASQTPDRQSDRPAIESPDEAGVSAADDGAIARRAVPQIAVGSIETRSETASSQTPDADVVHDALPPALPPPDVPMSGTTPSPWLPVDLTAAAAELHAALATPGVDSGSVPPEELPEADVDPFKTPLPLDVAAPPAQQTFESTAAAPQHQAAASTAPPDPSDEAVPIIDSAAAPRTRSRALAVFAAPFWAVAYLVVLVGRPFAGVSPHTKNLFGLLAGITFIMAAVVWFLPSLLGRAAPPERQPPSATSRAPVSGGH